MRQKNLAIALAAIGILILVRFEPKYVTSPNYGLPFSVTKTTKDGLAVTLTRLPDGRYDWQEYNYTLENQGQTAAEHLTVRVPVYGAATAFQCWGMEAECEYGVITIHCPDVLEPGQKYECINGEKFGYSGGGLLRTPQIVKE